jgi:pyruvate,water dikinase
VKLDELEDAALDEEIHRRRTLLDHYQELYWEYFIPFGHAFRLFGEVYNRYVVPDSPFEFIDLLSSDTILSIQRNSQIQEISRMLQESPETADHIRNGVWDSLPEEFVRKVYSLMELLGSSAYGDERLFKDPRELMLYLAGLSLQTVPGQYREAVDTSDTAESLTHEFLNIMGTRSDIDGEQLLNLAKYSYSLRDNDNLYLGRIKTEYLRSLEEQNRRTGGTQEPTEEPTETPSEEETQLRTEGQTDFSLVSRQLTGAPAVQGIGSGTARVIRNQQDLKAFQPGEVIVCNAVDPTITFIVPLAAAIVEKRGGMLIHGAIIAREYGIPCVTGVEEADELIQSGYYLMVDGYLGIVTVTDQRTSR